MLALITIDTKYYYYSEELNFKPVHDKFYLKNGYTELYKTIYHNSNYGFFILKKNDMVPMDVKRWKEKVISKIREIKTLLTEVEQPFNTLQFDISFIESEDKFIE